jgi:hypothetical protein
MQELCGWDILLAVKNTASPGKTILTKRGVNQVLVVF